MILTLPISWSLAFRKKHCAIYVAMCDITQSKAARLSHEVDAFGPSAHCSLCMLLVGVAKPEQSVFDSILILCIQHGFVMFQYFHKKIYIIIETVLEAWFKWSVLWNYKLFCHAACALLIFCSRDAVSCWHFIRERVPEFIGIRRREREYRFNEESDWCTCKLWGWGVWRLRLWYNRHFESVDYFRVCGDGNEYETTGFVFKRSTAQIDAFNMRGCILYCRVLGPRWW